MFHQISLNSLYGFCPHYTQQLHPSPCALPPTPLPKRSLLITTHGVGPPFILTASLAQVPNYPGSWQISDGSADYCWQIQLGVKSASCLDEINSASFLQLFFPLLCTLNSRSCLLCHLTFCMSALAEVLLNSFPADAALISFLLCDREMSKVICIKCILTLIFTIVLTS